MGPAWGHLADGRLHFQHGPIDLVIQVDGEAGAVQLACAQAWTRFARILPELIEELHLLRQPVGEVCHLQGSIARRMWHACSPYYPQFITPMAAVAGAVADEMLSCFCVNGITRASINNGGDIALYLTPGASYRIGLFSDLGRLDPAANRPPLLPDGSVHCDGHFTVDHAAGMRGIATSGWRGRSFSMGIADSVSVLARTAAFADAAATIIANAVNVDDERILRRPACELKDDTDLGSLPVTVDVPRLPDELVEQAVGAGIRRARQLKAAGLVHSVVIVCQGVMMTVAPAERGVAALTAPATSEVLSVWPRAASGFQTS